MDYVQQPLQTAPYLQIRSVRNPAFRSEWVRTTLNLLNPEHRSIDLLDVGAGLSPYKAFAESLGYRYTSHDFSNYVPSDLSPGIQSSSWSYPVHDWTCDILDVPDEAEADVVICTEVLEHVPDPVRALEKLAQLTRPSGYLLITVPFLSLMHQSPHWYQSGLSPFWFDYWSSRFGLETRELLVFGDYVDLMEQELARLVTFKHRVPGLARLSSLARGIRPLLPQAVLEAGGHGTLFYAQKESL